MADEKATNLRRNTFVSPPTHVDWVDGTAFVYHASGGRTVLSGADADAYARELGRHSSRFATAEDEMKHDEKAEADRKAGRNPLRPETLEPMGGEPDPANPVSSLGRAVRPDTEPTPTDPAPGSQPAPVIATTPPPLTEKVPAQLVAEDGLMAAGGVHGQEGKVTAAAAEANPEAIQKLRDDAEAAEDEADDEGEAGENGDDLNAKTVAELKEIADGEGVDMAGLGHAPKKKDYVRRIKNARRKAGASEGETD